MTLASRTNIFAICGRVAVILAGAIWLGGITFYTGVVIPTAHNVLGSHRDVGFITQKVTGWINLIAVIALVIFLFNVGLAGRSRGGVRTRWLWTAWGMMTALQVALVVLHPMIDRLLDPTTRQINDFDRFDALHRTYVIVTTAQLFFGLLYLIAALSRWRSLDSKA